MVDHGQPFDLVIAGGGMVGLTLACALGGSSLRVAVVDPTNAADRYDALLSASQADFDPRVSALTQASQNILTHLGAWPLMSALRLCPYRQMAVWDGEGTSAIRFDAAELQRRHLGHIVENRVTVAALHHVLQQHANINLLEGCRILRVGNPQPDASGALQRLVALDDGRELSAALVVAADGARSATRAQLGLTISEWDYGHHALVTTLTLDRSHQHTAWQRFTEDGPLALLPLPTLADGKHRVSIVWSTSPAHARALSALDDAEFCTALQRAVESRFGVEACDARHCFPLTQRHAARYVDDAAALVGDAAHTIHPLAGQGVNLGLLDAATLAEELLRAQQRGESLGELRVLRRYQRRRQGENLKMMGLMAGLKHLYDEVPPAVQWLRNWGLRQVAGQLPLRQWLSSQALGLSGELPQAARDRPFG